MRPEDAEFIGVIPFAYQWAHVRNAAPGLQVQVRLERRFAGVELE